jgi:hypothetical protein
MGGLDHTDKQVSADTLRKRRWRKHLKDGGAVLRVPVKDINATTGVLLDLRWLPLAESEDRKRIGEAVGALIDDLTLGLK